MLRFAAYLLVCIFLFAGSADLEAATKRVALVIGNSVYEHATPLTNPENDAKAVSEALVKLGFEVVRGTNLKHLDFAQIVGEFRKKLKDADSGVFFYAGHGLQVNGKNYLVPIDAQLEYEDSLEFEAVTLNAILRLMERETQTNIVFLDACRDNPLARNLASGMGTRSTAVGQGMARVEAGIGTMISFATQPGNVALDGSGNHSPFTAALLNHIETPGLDIANLMRAVRLEVLTSTGRKQVPWSNSSLTGSFFFKGKPNEKVSKNAIEQTYWQAIRSSQDKRLYEGYLKQFPEGEYVVAARGMIDEIDAAETVRLKARKEAEAKALAEAKARAKAEDQARAEAEARANAEAVARAEAEARTKAMEEAQKRLEAAVKARDIAEARIEAEAKARAEAEQRAKTEASARARAEAEAEARAKAVAEAQARAELEAKEREEAVARANQMAEARKKSESEAKARQEARAKEQAREQAAREQFAKVQAEKMAREEAEETKIAGLPAASVPQNASDLSLAVELAYWTSIKDLTDVRAVKSYLERYPKGQFANVARMALEQISLPGVPVTIETKDDAAKRAAKATKSELEYWENIKDEASTFPFETYLEEFPKGAFSDLAKIKLAVLKARTERSAEHKKKYPFDGLWRLEYQTNGRCRVKSGEYFVTIKNGKIWIGDPKGRLSKRGNFSLLAPANRSGWALFFHGQLKNNSGSGTFVSRRGKRVGKCGGRFKIALEDLAQ